MVGTPDVYHGFPETAMLKCPLVHHKAYNKADHQRKIQSLFHTGFASAAGIVLTPQIK